MAWVPLQESGVSYSFNNFPDTEPSGIYFTLEGSEISLNTGTHARLGTGWELYFDDPVTVRITTEYEENDVNRSYLWWEHDEVNEPIPLEIIMEDVVVVAFETSYTQSSGSSSINYKAFLEVWIEEGPDPGPEPGPSTGGYHVYELDRGWSFDGYYIPHFAELNWYFADNPFVDKSIQKVRIHGLAKGHAKLSLAVAGMQHEYDSDYTEPQYIDLPLNAAHINTEYFPTTNYVDSSNWGVSLQLKFEGRNTDITKPEPVHVLQVLALQGSPQDNGRRID